MLSILSPQSASCRLKATVNRCLLEQIHFFFIRQTQTELHVWCHPRWHQIQFMFLCYNKYFFEYRNILPPHAVQPTSPHICLACTASFIYHHILTYFSMITVIIIQSVVFLPAVCLNAVTVPFPGPHCLPQLHYVSLLPASLPSFSHPFALLLVTCPVWAPTELNRPNK